MPISRWLKTLILSAAVWIGVPGTASAQSGPKQCDPAAQRAGVDGTAVLRDALNSQRANEGTPLASEKATECAAAAKKLQARKDELDQLLNTLENGTMTMETVKKLARWSKALEMTIHETKASDFLISTAEGAGTGTVTNLLVTGTAGFSLASTGVGAIVAAYYQVMKDAFGNMIEIEKAIANTALHQWLLGYLQFNEVDTPSDKLLNFIERAPGFLQTASGEAPPKKKTKSFLGVDALWPDAYDNAEVTAYLKRNAESIYMYIGLLEEVHGAKAFPRYKFSPVNAHMLEVGYYRKVMTPRIKRDLQKIKRQLDQLEVKSCE